MMRALVAGWFSFEQCGATAGDLMARDVVGRWLDEAGLAYDIATAPPFVGGVDWRQASPEAYTHVVFVCGPFGNGPPVAEFLDRFRGRTLLGMNLSMLDAVENWNPFNALWERDSTRDARPDLSLLAPASTVPLIGLIRSHRQKEYGDRAWHDRLDPLIDRVLRERGGAVIEIDTCLEHNAGGLTTPEQVEAVIQRTDVVLTTRLHGTVLAIKNGVPAVALDPIAGGAKIAAQCRSLDWPYCLIADRADAGQLAAALDACLQPAARQLAVACRDRAVERLAPLREQFLQSLEQPATARSHADETGASP